ncbi:putative transcriptional regulator [Chitinispirillum alkaliphilum]|nr:putative transcriptional regulator [Chitinispirillum alkaliphilum]
MNLTGLALPKKIMPVLLIITAFTALYYQNEYSRLQNILSQMDPGTVSFEKIKEVFPQAHGISAADNFEGASEIIGQENEILGYYLDSRPYSDNIRGYAGPVPLLILFDSDEVIKEVVLLENNETKSFIRRLVNADFLLNWQGVTLQEASQKRVDAISSATLSCDAIEEAIRVRTSVYMGYQKDRSNGAAFSVVQILFLIPVALYLLTLVKTSKFSRYRRFLPIISFLIFGLLTASMLSLSLFSSWAFSGVSLTSQWPLVAVVLVVALFLLFKGQNIYCAFFCPFGMVQVLLARLPVKKVRLPGWISRKIPLFRSLVLLTVFGLFFVYRDFDPVYVEPFAAFRPSGAPLIVVILAGVFTVVSLFIPRLWCRMFCPTGRCLDLVKDSKR